MVAKMKVRGRLFIQHHTLWGHIPNAESGRGINPGFMQGTKQTQMGAVAPN